MSTITLIVVAAIQFATLALVHWAFQTFSARNAIGASIALVFIGAFLVAAATKGLSGYSMAASLTHFL